MAGRSKAAHRLIEEAKALQMLGLRGVPCRPEGLRLAARLREANKPVQLLEYPRLPHGFASLTHLSVAAQRAVAEIGARAAGLVEG
jgi:acetyl esterase/lipase